ncbi:S8 family serine peptidase [Novosphingobium sp. ZN18A2]|uniref:S8 family serine peptidase n=1 Tax=Novosphingobium sp. ZN18A2 TaxID=3079861 RepID=UPI0030CF7EC2
MRKIIIVSSMSALALAGAVYAASGGAGGGAGGSFITLPASAAGGGSPAATLNATPAAVDTAVDDSDASLVADSWICVFKPGLTRAAIRSEAAKAAHAAGGSLGHVYKVALQGFSLKARGNAVDAMKAHNPRIDYCTADKVARIIDPADAGSDKGPGANKGKPGSGGGSTGQETPWGIARVGGGATYTGSNSAWIIDTGIDLDHPDLNVDTARSANFVTRETSPDDLNGHGSHVAGTIGAIDNSEGVVGVAANVPVVAVRVLNRRGSGSYSDVIAGIEYVATNGKSGDVANMSLGGPADQTLDYAVINAASKGIRFALAAGNEADDANNHSPGRANGPNIYTISAIDNTDTFAYFSNFGNPPVDFAEPGVNIKSTWKNAGYNTISGTSMATPHAAGLLLWGNIATDRYASADPDGNPDPIGHK